MPTYSYRCPKCCDEHVEFMGINDKRVIKCRVCGTVAKRQIGTGGFVKFKGSGFPDNDAKAARVRKK